MNKKPSITMTIQEAAEELVRQMRMHGMKVDGYYLYYNPARGYPSDLEKLRLIDMPDKRMPRSKVLVTMQPISEEEWDTLEDAVESVMKSNVEVPGKGKHAFGMRNPGAFKRQGDGN